MFKHVSGCVVGTTSALPLGHLYELAEQLKDNHYLFTHSQRLSVALYTDLFTEAWKNRFPGSFLKNPYHKKWRLPGSYSEMPNAQAYLESQNIKKHYSDVNHSMIAADGHLLNTNNGFGSAIDAFKFDRHMSDNSNFFQERDDEILRLFSIQNADLKKMVLDELNSFRNWVATISNVSRINLITIPKTIIRDESRSFVFPSHAGNEICQHYGTDHSNIIKALDMHQKGESNSCTPQYRILINGLHSEHRVRTFTFYKNDQAHIEEYDKRKAQLFSMLLQYEKIDKYFRNVNLKSSSLDELSDLFSENQLPFDTLRICGNVIVKKYFTIENTLALFEEGKSISTFLALSALLPNEIVDKQLRRVYQANPQETNLFKITSQVIDDELINYFYEYDEDKNFVEKFLQNIKVPLEKNLPKSFDSYDETFINVLDYTFKGDLLRKGGFYWIFDLFKKKNITSKQIDGLKRVYAHCNSIVGCHLAITNYPILFSHLFHYLNKNGYTREFLFLQMALEKKAFPLDQPVTLKDTLATLPMDEICKKDPGSPIFRIIRSLIDLFEQAQKESDIDCLLQQLTQDQIIILDCNFEGALTKSNKIEALIKVFELKNLSGKKVKAYADFVFGKISEKEQPMILESANLPLLFGYLFNKCDRNNLSHFMSIYNQSSKKYQLKINWVDLLKRLIVYTYPGTTLWKDTKFFIHVCRSQILKSKKRILRKLPSENLTFYDYCLNGQLLDSKPVDRFRAFFDRTEMSLELLKHYGKLIFGELPAHHEELITGANPQLLFGYLFATAKDNSGLLISIYEEFKKESRTTSPFQAFTRSMMKKETIPKLVSNRSLWLALNKVIQINKDIFLKEIHELKQDLDEETWAFIDMVVLDQLENRDPRDQLKKLGTCGPLNIVQLRSFGSNIFSKIPEEEHSNMIETSSINHMYSYLFYQMDKHFEGDIPSSDDERCKYNWIRLQLEGFYLLANNPKKYAEKYTTEDDLISSDKYIPYNRSGVYIGINMADLIGKSIDHIAEQLLLGHELLKNSFEDALNNQRFKKLFANGFDYGKGTNGSLQDRCNTLQEYLLGIWKIV